MKAAGSIQVFEELRGKLVFVRDLKTEVTGSESDELGHLEIGIRMCRQAWMGAINIKKDHPTFKPYVHHDELKSHPTNGQNYRVLSYMGTKQRIKDREVQLSFESYYVQKKEGEQWIHFWTCSRYESSDTRVDPFQKEAADADQRVIHTHFAPKIAEREFGELSGWDRIGLEAINEPKGMIDRLRSWKSRIFVPLLGRFAHKPATS